MALSTPLLTVAQELITFPTLAGNQQAFQSCIAYIEKFFDHTGLHIETHWHEGVPSIVVTKGTKTPRIFLNGHLDIVDADMAQFTPRIEGDRLYGRGSWDMKGAVAVMMMVMRDLARTEHDVGLMLVGDEETGGMNGTKHLLDLGYRCESVVIPDGGYAIDRIATKAKGIAWVTVYAEGESGHASRPWSGASAIDRLRTALDMIMSSFTPLTDHPQNHWESTCSIGRIEGGVSTNQIAARAEAEIDIRYTEEFDVTNWLSQMRAELPQGVTLEYQFGAPMLHTNESHPHVVGYKDAIESVLGQKAEFTVDHGASDARFFSELGIPAMLSQPTGGDMHGPQEWVSIASLGMYYDVLRTFLDQHAG